MRLTVLVVVGVLIGLGGAALGMGGNLDKPSISIPCDPVTKEPDPVTQKIADVFRSHEKRFTGGSFINSHSELYFAGGAKGVNALLGDLAKVEGATVLVQLSKEAGVTQWKFATTTTQADSPCDCKIDHVGWGDARVVTLKVYLGGSRIEPSELELPAVTGRAPRAGK